MPLSKWTWVLFVPECSFGRQGLLQYDKHFACWSSYVKLPFQIVQSNSTYFTFVNQEGKQQERYIFLAVGNDSWLSSSTKIWTPELNYWVAAICPLIPIRNRFCHSKQTGNLRLWSMLSIWIIPYELRANPFIDISCRVLYVEFHMLNKMPEPLDNLKFWCFRKGTFHTHPFLLSSSFYKYFISSSLLLYS